MTALETSDVLNSATGQLCWNETCVKNVLQSFWLLPRAVLKLALPKLKPVFSFTEHCQLFATHAGAGNFRRV